MKLWLLERTDHVGYDETAGVIVAAPTEQAARTLFPADGWRVEQSKIKVELIGTAAKGTLSTVLLIDFRAG